MLAQSDKASTAACNLEFHGSGSAQAGHSVLPSLLGTRFDIDSSDEENSLTGRVTGHGKSLYIQNSLTNCLYDIP